VSRVTRSPSSARACIWHRSTQIQQPWQVSDSSRAMNELATISDGLG
jgi:hypothetical protein